jgi:hypothetical protein
MKMSIANNVNGSFLLFLVPLLYQLLTETLVVNKWYCSKKSWLIKLIMSTITYMLLLTLLTEIIYKINNDYYWFVSIPTV